MTAIKVQGRDDVLTVMRKAREARGITHLEMDERVGLGSGHYGKIERMGADWGKAALRLNPSVMNCLDFLGLEIIVAPKGEIAAETAPRDVRLIPESNVVRMPVHHAAHGPAMGWFGSWLRERETVAQAKKKPRQAVRRARPVAGATCQEAVG